MRRGLLVIALLCTMSCGGGERTLPATPTNLPSRGTLTLSGTVTETAPTESTTIAGARVTILDGPNAGRQGISDANGAFKLDALKAGGFSIRIEAANYVTHSEVVTMSADETRTIALDPVFQTVTAVSEESIAGARDCPGYWDAARYGAGTQRRDVPCTVEYVFSVHHAGTLDAQVTWPDRDVFFWMELYRLREGLPSGETGESSGSGSQQRIGSPVSAHTQYLLRVRVVDSGGGPAPARTMPFTLTVTRPN